MQRYIVEVGVCVSWGDDNGQWYTKTFLIDASSADAAFDAAKAQVDDDGLVYVFPYHITEDDDLGVAHDPDAIAGAITILGDLGVPASRLGALAFLVLAGIGPDDQLGAARREIMRPHDILKKTAQDFGVRYAENTRETLRDFLASLVKAGVAEHNPDNPNRAAQSPKNNYALSKSFVESLKRR